MNRTYLFQGPGKVTITDTSVYKIPSKGPRELRFNPAGVKYSGEHWEVLRFDGDLTKIKNVNISGDDIYFELVNPKVREIKLRFTTVLKYSAVPTRRGAMLYLDPYCCEAKSCQLKFKGVGPNGSIRLLNNDLQEIYKSSPGKTSFGAAELAHIARLKLHLVGEAHRSAAWRDHTADDLFSHLETRINISKDGAADIRERIYFDDPHESVCINLSWYSLDTMGHLFGVFEGVERRDSLSCLELKANQFRYSLLQQATTVDNGRQRIIVPLPQPTRGNFSFVRNISERKQIEIEYPPELQLRFQLFEDANFGRELRPIETELKNEPGKTIFFPAEGQIARMWLLQAELLEGSFAEPGFLKYLRYAFASYHMTGYYPRWLFWFYFCCITAPLVGAIVFFRIRARRKHAKSARRKEAKKEADIFRDLRKRDPAFDIEAFMKRSREITTKIQHAWTAGDMSGCRRYLSQGVYNRFRIQLKIMRESERRQNAMADFRILNMSVVESLRSGPYDALIVRLEAEARDVMVDVTLSPAKAQAAAKKARRQGFVEYYSFMRRQDARTENISSLEDCSHCGTPFTAEGEITKCKSCGAIMGSGTFDWVLAEITQEIEYGRRRRPKLPPKDISPDRLEDRASFLFWRNAIHDLTGKKEYLFRDATPEYFSNLSKGNALSDIAVGAADLMEYQGGQTLRAKVRIKWSAKDPANPWQLHRRSVLTLVANPRHMDGVGFAEHSCKACGAPLPEMDSENCYYCRSPIEAKNNDWLLESIATTVK